MIEVHCRMHSLRKPISAYGKAFRGWNWTLSQCSRNPWFIRVFLSLHLIARKQPWKQNIAEKIRKQKNGVEFPIHLKIQVARQNIQHIIFQINTQRWNLLFWWQLSYQELLLIILKCGFSITTMSPAVRSRFFLGFLVKISTAFQVYLATNIIKKLPINLHFQWIKGDNFFGVTL